MRQGTTAAIVVTTIAACALYGGLVDQTDDASDPAASEASVAPGTVPVDQRRHLSLVATGDLLSHTSVVTQARADDGGSGYAYQRMLAPVQPIIAGADVAICHLETPVAPPGAELGGYGAIFGAPADVAGEMVAVGYDRCSVASNHSLDQRVEGIDVTLDAFDAVGLGHAGMARSAPEAGPTHFEVGGVALAHISASYGFNGFSPPVGEEWRVNPIDPARIVREAREARAAGADVVVVSLHWGTEGQRDPTLDQRRVADEITASGAVDLILGHHSHVVQPIEQVNGRWVVFGMGNQLSGMGDQTNCCGVRAMDGLMVRISIQEQADGSFVVDRPEAVPTFNGRRPYRVVPVVAALADPGLAGHIRRSDLADSLARTSEVVGEFIDGPVP